MSAIADIAATAATRDWRMLIGGELVPAAEGATYVTIDPSTEEEIVAVPAASRQDVERAVTAAVGAAEDWGRTDLRERARLVRRVADILLEHELELATLDALDGGNPVTAMRGDVRIAAEITRMFADCALELRGETIPAQAGSVHYTVREPYGVVARIVPYNHPLMFAAGRAAAPLVAGNCVVMKAPDQTPLSALRLGELLADVLPPGVLGIVTGAGTVAGDALVRHPDVRRIGFIGSVPTGRAIQRAAAESGVKHVTLELGGKNSLLVFEDADPQDAAAGAIRGMNFHWTGGQSCGSTSRLLVHESLAERVVEDVCRLAGEVRVGAPLDPRTEMGPMVSGAHRDRVLDLVEAGTREGASLLTGGVRPEGAGFDRGFFVAPTVFGGVEPGTRLAQEEAFGPILSVLTFRDEDEAVRIANGTAYGLTASIWTADVRRAHRVAHRLEAGYIWVNTASTHYWGTPFGGYKDSGIGREEGVEELLSMTQTKTVNIPFTEVAR
jgi:acyl-CoA reductase-like NAD-dependent aldehyde dehydrogenase